MSIHRCEITACDRLNPAEGCPVHDPKVSQSTVMELLRFDDDTLREAYEGLSPHEQARLKSWLGIAAGASSEKLLVGSVVQLASGGPKMTVLERIEGKVSGFTESKTVCRCMFCFESKLVEAMIPEAALKLAHLAASDREEARERSEDG